MERNRNFTCPVCGNNDGLPPSIVLLHVNYGSYEHDMEQATIKLCGGCFDRIYAIIQSMLPAETIDVAFSC